MSKLILDTESFNEIINTLSRALKLIKDAKVQELNHNKSSFYSDFALDYATHPWDYHWFRTMDFEVGIHRFRDKKHFGIVCYGFAPKELSSYAATYRNSIDLMPELYKHIFGYYDDFDSCYKAWRKVIQDLVRFTDKELFE